MVSPDFNGRGRRSTTNRIFILGTASNSARYSFDRVFIVGPAGSGSRAQTSGWQYVILSDQWHIRDHSTNKAFQPEPELPSPAFGNHIQQQQQSFAQPTPAAQPQSFGATQPFSNPSQAAPQPPFGVAQSFSSPIQVAPQPQHPFPHSFTPPSAHATPPPPPPPTPQSVTPTPSERAPGIVS